MRRIERESVYKSTGSRHFRRYYDYNRENQRTSEQRIQDHEQTDSYTYDSMQRLVVANYDDDATWGATWRAVRQQDFELDGVGNRREVTPYSWMGALSTEDYSVNEMNEYTSVDGTSRTHSKNGNLTDDGTRLFVYDYKNRLVEVSDKSSGDPIADYYYDASNRRTKKAIYDGQSIDKEIIFIYDGWQVVEELDDNDDPLSYFVWHGQAYIDELVKFKRTDDHPSGSGTFFVHQNARKDVMGLTNWWETRKDTVVYDAFGRLYDKDTKVAVDEMGEGCPYFFQGRRLDPETGLYYFRNRMYDPRTGRFLQRDPVWDHNNVGNQYAFVGNGPVSGWDPLGMGMAYNDTVVDGGSGSYKPTFDELPLELRLQIRRSQVRNEKVYLATLVDPQGLDNSCYTVVKSSARYLYRQASTGITLVGCTNPVSLVIGGASYWAWNEVADEVLGPDDSDAMLPEDASKYDAPYRTAPMPSAYNSLRWASFWQKRSLDLITLVGVPAIAKWSWGRTTCVYNLSTASRINLNRPPCGPPGSSGSYGGTYVAETNWVQVISDELHPVTSHAAEAICDE